ncbi:ROK family protein [Agrobacterium sp. rho-13.3]|uniref:ROK family protein n=1 Tax=Agrobacterium sp. rho-13.3 TaxID=3072980 RepID=UPI002A0C8A31|nr:ROK family protein [Agrobacterium sp. rho-13.3]MDX8308100.1 ROK family protein [Agrobacterium sp. rho-13.3]
MTGAVTVIDVGGTHLRWANWTPERGTWGRRSALSPNFRRYPTLSAPELQTRLIDSICDIVPHTDDTIVGLSFGAALNQLTGTVYASAPLWGPYDTPLNVLDILSRKRGDVAWHVVNDVTAALLHVASQELCKQDRKVMLVTISTGIAARTIDRRTSRIPLDASGLQGEIGHLPMSAVLFDRPIILKCDCGEPGHLSAYASGPGIRQMALALRERYPRDWENSLLGHGDGMPWEETFSSALVAGDSIATKLLDAVTAPVADVLRTALCLDPDLDRIVLTGGVAVGLGAHYRNAILSHLRCKGLYLTSKFTPQWIEDRIVVSDADCLVGAGIAALMERVP